MRTKCKASPTWRSAIMPILSRIRPTLEDMTGTTGQALVQRTLLSSEIWYGTHLWGPRTTIKNPISKKLDQLAGTTPPRLDIQQNNRFMTISSLNWIPRIDFLRWLRSIVRTFSLPRGKPLCDPSHLIYVWYFQEEVPRRPCILYYLRICMVLKRWNRSK